MKKSIHVYKYFSICFYKTLYYVHTFVKYDADEQAKASNCCNVVQTTGSNDKSLHALYGIDALLLELYNHLR